MVSSECRPISKVKGYKYYLERDIMSKLKTTAAALTRYTVRRDTVLTNNAVVVSLFPQTCFEPNPQLFICANIWIISA